MISLTPSLLVSLSRRRFSRNSQLLKHITWISSISVFTHISREAGREPIEIHFSKVWPSLRWLSRTPCLIDFFFLTRNEILWKSDRWFSRRYRVTHKARRMNGRCLNISVSFCGRFRKIAEKKTQMRHIYQSICSHGTTRLPLDGFSWNLIFENFSKIYEKYSSFIKNWQV